MGLLYRKEEKRERMSRRLPLEDPSAEERALFNL